VSELLGGGANFASRKVLCCDVLQHPRLRRGYVVQSVVQDVYSAFLVFNFWEPLHYLDRGHGFQTWETSPEYAIRSYAYIALHLISVKIPRFLFGDEKVWWDEPNQANC
jgi:hypothetical protein